MGYGLESPPKPLMRIRIGDQGYSTFDANPVKCMRIRIRNTGLQKCLPITDILAVSFLNFLPKSKTQVVESRVYSVFSAEKLAIQVFAFAVKIVSKH